MNVKDWTEHISGKEQYEKSAVSCWNCSNNRLLRGWKTSECDHFMFVHHRNNESYEKRAHCCLDYDHCPDNFPEDTCSIN